MAIEQLSVTQAFTQAAIEITKAAVLEVMEAREEIPTGQKNEAVNVRPRIGIPLLKQLTCGWSSAEKYAKLRNLRMKVNNVSNL